MLPPFFLRGDGGDVRGVADNAPWLKSRTMQQRGRQ